MKITFSPVRRDETLMLERAGEALIVNGEEFDFAPLGDGDTLSEVAIASPWFCGPVMRINGVLHIEMVLPHGPEAPEAARFPKPAFAQQDGAVALPGADISPQTTAGA